MTRQISFYGAALVVYGLALAVFSVHALGQTMPAAAASKKDEYKGLVAADASPIDPTEISREINSLSGTTFLTDEFTVRERPFPGAILATKKLIFWLATFERAHA